MTYQLTEADLKIFEKARADGRFFTDHYFDGWVFDHNIVPPWQLAFHHAAQTQIVVITGAGAGKAQPLNAPILTPAGWVAMGDLSIGDLVIGSDGLGHPVLGIYPQGIKQIYSIHFDDGASVEACGDHLWNVSTYKSRLTDREWITVDTNYLSACLESGKRNPAFYVPLPKPVQFQGSGPLPIEPYLLGALLGDGNLREHSVRFWTLDAEILESIARLAPAGVKTRHIGGCGYAMVAGSRGIQYNPLLSDLRELGLTGKRSWEKSIPKAYLYADIESRIALLRGLMDTDGNLGRRGTCAEFTSTSQTLAYQVADLARSLGGVARVFKKSPHFTYKGERKDGRCAFRVSIDLPVSIVPFSLERKRSGLQAKDRCAGKRMITRVVAVGENSAQCILVDSPNHLYVTQDYILTHNSGMVGISACTWAATTPFFKFMNVAPTIYQSELMYNYILEHAEDSRFAKMIHKAVIKPYPKIVLKIKMPKKWPPENEADWFTSTSVLEFMTAGKQANLILSFEGDWINVDEAGLLTDLDETLVRLSTRLRGTIKGRERLGRLSLTSNPHINSTMYYLYDMGLDDPLNCLSIQRTTRSNRNITDRQITQITKHIPEHERDRWLMGQRPEGAGKEFPPALIDLCEDPGLDATMDEMTGKPGYIVQIAPRCGIVVWEMPWEEGRTYLEVMDPGQGTPPFRNAPVISTWDITDFPRLPAGLRAFWWGFGGGTYTPCITQFKLYHQQYRVSFAAHDSTGTQKGFEEMFQLQEQMMVEGIDLSVGRKYECHLALKMLMNRGLMKWPRLIKGIRQQLVTYELPDTKIAQDIVSNFQMVGGFLRRFYWLDASGKEEASEPLPDYDRLSRVVVDRAERATSRV